MFDALINSVLPIFAITGLGMILARAGVFDSAAAGIINRFVFYLAMPVLMFRLLANIHVEDFNWAVIGSYFAVELVLYVVGAVLFRLVFRRGLKESLLLAMAIIFVNHLMFVLPISVAEFGIAASAPIAAIVALDIVVFYAGMVVVLEVLGADAQASGVKNISRRLIRNPQIWAIIAGVLASFFHLTPMGGLKVFTDFVGNAAAPCSLFALGVVLAVQKGQGSWLVPWLLTLIKLAVMPVLAFVLLISGLGLNLSVAGPALLVAAGPVGAMPFVLALQYGEPVEEIARAILISTLLSLVTISLVLQFL